MQPLIDMRTQVWYNPDLISAYNMVPAMIGMILLFLTIQLTAAAVVRERERGTMEQLAVTPLTSAELMIGKLAPFVVIAMLDTVEIVIVGVLIFNVPINGSLVLLFVLIVAVPDDYIEHRTAHFHHRPHAARGADELDAHHAAGAVSLRLLFSYRRDAEIAPVH